MKKTITLLLIAALLLTVCACGKKAEEPAPAPSEEPTVSTAPAATTDPNTVHVERTPEPERTPSPEATAAPKPTAAPTPTPYYTPVVTTPAPTPVPTAPPVPEVSISSGSAVYSLVDNAGSFTADDGSSYNYQYKIPAFGCTGPDTELLSEELYNALMPTIEAQLAAMQSGSAPEVSSVDYAAYSNGRYISVLCSIYKLSGGADYKAVTLNADSGYRASNSELMQYCGVAEGDFAALASQAAGAKYAALYGDTSARAYNDTVNLSNFANVELFINSSGRLSFAAFIYSPDGTWFRHIVSI